MENIKKFIEIYSKREVLLIALLGFFSGLPLALTASSLTVWLTESGITKSSIGLFGMIGTPYVLKFLWSPLIDHIPLPGITRLLGRRRSWIILTQFMVVVCLIGMGFSNPAINPWNTALWAVLVAISSASQDIVIDAYRVERLSYEQLGPGAAAVNFGYRMGMLVAGAGALVMAEFWGWVTTYLVMAGIMAVGVIVTLFLREPKSKKLEKAKSFFEWIDNAVLSPFENFVMSHQAWGLILIFVVLYKLGDALAGMMTNPFLIEIGFTKSEIAAIVKTYGLVATLAGAFIGGYMVKRIGMMRSLLICGIFQMVSNLMFSVQAMVGHNVWMLMLTISVENFAGGMGAAAFVAYLSSLCNINFTATQYALLSSLSAVGRIWLSSFSGFLVESVGWVNFFVWSTVAALPGVMMIYFFAHNFSGTVNSGAAKPSKKKKSK